MGSFAIQQYLLDHSTETDAVILTGTAAIDLLEPALDLDQPLELALFNGPFAPAGPTTTGCPVTRPSLTPTSPTRCAASA